MSLEGWVDPKVMPLLRFLCLSEAHGASYRLIGSPNPSHGSVWPTFRLRVFRTSATVCPRAHNASHRLGVLFKVLPNSQGLASTRLLPQGLVSLQRDYSGEATCTGIASPGYLRPQGLSPSRRLNSSPGLPGLVSCRVRPWDSFVQPFRSGNLPKQAPLGMGGTLRYASP